MKYIYVYQRYLCLHLLCQQFDTQANVLDVIIIFILTGEIDDGISFLIPGINKFTGQN